MESIDVPSSQASSLRGPGAVVMYQISSFSLTAFHLRMSPLTHIRDQDYRVDVYKENDYICYAFTLFHYLFIGCISINGNDGNITNVGMGRQHRAKFSPRDLSRFIRLPPIIRRGFKQDDCI